MLTFPQAMIEICNYLEDSLDCKEHVKEVMNFASDKNKWHKANNIFNTIRSHHLKYLRNENIDISIDYEFLELCVKSIYHLGGFQAPFDLDSQYEAIVLSFQIAESKEGKCTSTITEILLK